MLSKKKSISHHACFLIILGKPQCLCIGLHRVFPGSPYIHDNVKNDLTVFNINEMGIKISTYLPLPFIYCKKHLEKKKSEVLKNEMLTKKRRFCLY